MAQVKYHLRWLDSMEAVDAAAWDTLARALETPFLEWEWLHQLEASGSITADTGWIPHHLSVWADDHLVAAAPLYLKLHSEGEFVFDQGWADLAQRLGIDYYPKLVGMSPVTPVSGYRFLISPTQDSQAITGMMVGAIEAFCRNHRISGCSFLFADPDWRVSLNRFGFTGWTHQGFRWVNRSFGNFQDYLNLFNANQRRNIRRERNALRKTGITASAFGGDDIPHRFMSRMYRFYEQTNAKFGPWGCRFLTPAFFQGIYRRYRHRLLIMAAFKKTDPDRPVGMAFLLRKGDQLYGRYWGSAQETPMLHFDICYYRPIEWAIAQGIGAYDPGMGSAHKIRRGFIAVPTYSMHRFYHPHLQTLFDRYIGDINRKAQAYISSLNAHLPFAHRDRMGFSETATGGQANRE